PPTTPSATAWRRPPGCSCGWPGCPTRRPRPFWTTRRPDGERALSQTSKRTFDLSAGKRALLEKMLRAEGLGRAAARSIPRRGPPGEAPLSAAQRRLWFFQQLDPSSPLYHMPMRVRLTGPLDPVALRSALAAVVGRHEALRTAVELREGRPVGRVVEIAFELPTTHLTPP